MNCIPYQRQGCRGAMMPPIFETGLAGNCRPGATTIDEYRKHIEKDAALEDVFKHYGGPTVEESIGFEGCRPVQTHHR